MIYVNFAEDPAPFSMIREGSADCLKPYGLENAKVAHRQSYPIASNWKLALENYTECYHCAPAHPEYSRGHSLAIRMRAARTGDVESDGARRGRVD